MTHDTRKTAGGRTDRRMRLSLLIVLLGASLVTPAVSNAETTLKNLITSKAMPVVNSLIGLVMVLALLGFIVGAIRFIATAGDDRSRESGKQLMVWGVVALALMVSVWGVVLIIKTTFFG